MISIISAVAENGIIGKNNKLPWQLPADLAYFAKTTRGATVIMGLNTFKSIVSIIGKPLPGRKNIVIALEKDSTLLGCEQYTSIPEALDAANKEPISAFIIGGASIYAQTISLVDKLYITRVHAN
ncbi:TPA: hypothetical protein DCQ44_02265, partial [Candidatus Taylorbacteria bacterium]|nr:hypothetical protein [Candidatus Taylorbacteria bacterium]